MLIKNDNDLLESF